MSQQATGGPIKLLLPELEAEVVGEALELYLSTRRAPADPRFEYRYRAAQGVLNELHYRPTMEEEAEPPRRRTPPTED